VANITNAPTMNFSLIRFLSLSFIYNAGHTIVYNTAVSAPQTRITTLSVDNNCKSIN